MTIMTNTDDKVTVKLMVTPSC